jgi:hypothetical protein
MRLENVRRNLIENGRLFLQNSKGFLAIKVIAEFKLLNLSNTRSTGAAEKRAIIKIIRALYLPKHCA